MEYQCRTSEVIVERMAEYIETDDCVNACGVDRDTNGISSDALHEPHTTVKLCSPACYQNCPNIIDLYFNLAAGEGMIEHIIYLLLHGHVMRAFRVLLHRYIYLIKKLTY